MSEKKLLTYSEILSQIKGTELFSFHQKMGYALVTDSDDRVKRLFKMKGDKFEEVDVKAVVKMIAEYLSKHISLEKLLEDKLLHKPLEVILQLEKRVKAKGKVKEHKGCYFLVVKGEKGPPLEVDL